MTVTCPHCGEFEAPGGNAQGHVSVNQHGAICPKCDMTPGEHAYRLRIMADSTAVYAEEARAFRAKRLREAS